jgi:hypothetical protein
MKPLRSLILVCAFLVFAPVLAVAEQGAQTGTVAETMTAGGYVYIKLEEQGTWLAANAFAVSVGDKVRYSGGMEMNDFQSKALDRTFDSIWFVSQASLVGADGGDPHAASMEGKTGEDMPYQKLALAMAPAPGDIAPLKEGKTVASIFAESTDLKDQTVSLNARVMKVSRDIMGKNWITLQDGSGTEPDNKLLATTQELVSPGDLVIAKGKVVTDVDLGYGYAYKVLLEEASFSAGVE